jgi:hypothetical protein
MHGPTPLVLYGLARVPDAGGMHKMSPTNAANQLACASSIGRKPQQSVDRLMKLRLAKAANHPNMLPVVNSRKEVIQCLIVISPV